MNPEEQEDMFAAEGQEAMPPEINEQMEMPPEMLDAGDVPDDMYQPEEPQMSEEEMMMQQMMAEQEMPEPEIETKAENPIPVELLNEVINQYGDYILQIRNDKSLNEDIRSTIMSQMSQSLSYLVPLLVPADNGAESKQADMEMKMQEMQMQMQMKQAEMGSKQMSQQTWN
jgi:hypothetical protein